MCSICCDSKKEDALDEKPTDQRIRLRLLHVPLMVSELIGASFSVAVILLDLNYTLVENTREAHRLPAVYNVELETYRQWMLPFLIAHTVVLITVRPTKHKEGTLARIRELCDGWQPHLACFNEWRVAAPVSKERCLQRDVFPIYGKPEAGAYLALESNKDTRAMYAGYGIAAQTWADLQSELSSSGSLLAV